MTSSLPPPQLTFQKHLEVHKPHASPSLGTNNATGIACFSPVAGDFTLTLFPPSEYSQTKLGLTQHTLPSRKRPAKGKWTGRSTFPLVTPQSNSSMKGLDFVPPPPSPREEVSHFTKLMHSYRSGPMIPANELS